MRVKEWWMDEERQRDEELALEMMNREDELELSESELNQLIQEMEEIREWEEKSLELEQQTLDFKIAMRLGKALGWMLFYLERIVLFLRGKKGLHKFEIIVTPPGSRLLRLTELLFSSKSQELIFEPIASDWHDEYFEAIDKNRHPMKFYLINARHYWFFFKAVVFTPLIKAAVKLFAGG